MLESDWSEIGGYCAWGGRVRAPREGRPRDDSREVTKLTNAETSRCAVVQKYDENAIKRI